MEMEMMEKFKIQQCLMQLKSQLFHISICIASHIKAQKIFCLIEDSRVDKLNQRPNSVCVIFVSLKYIMQLFKIQSSESSEFRSNSTSVKSTSFLFFLYI